MRISVLFGGETEERDVSVASAAQIIPALRSRGHRVLAVDTVFGAVREADEPEILSVGVGHAPPSPARLAPARRAGAALRIPQAVRQSDLVFLALHGGSGEDGRLQALLDLAGVPYTGSGPLGSGLAMDKDVSKTLLRAGGLATPDWLIAPVSPGIVEAQLGFPVVVKPTAQGSTVGLSLVRNAAELSAAVERAAEHGSVMIERFVAGRELTVGVLAGEPLAVGEIHLGELGVFGYAEKYQAGAVTEEFPAALPRSVSAGVRSAAAAAHRIHRLDGYSRSDFRLDAAGQAWIIETNSLPGMTATSLLPQSAAAAGIDYAELCERICQEALKRQG